MKTILSWATVAALSLGALSACSSDSKSAATTAATTATAATGSSTSDAPTGASTAATTAGAPVGGSTSVDGFCKDIQDFAAKLKAAAANPSSADQAALSAQGQQLAADSTALIQANPAAVAQIEACAKSLTDAFSQFTP